MIYGLLTTILIIDCLVLAGAVLLQAGQGGGLAGLGGGASTDSFMGGRQATTVLTKLTWWTGGLFLGICVVLASMSTGTAAPSSVLEQIQPTQVQTAAPVIPLTPTAPAATTPDSGN
jgi:preprotein translocase subunit SecG